MNEELVKKRLEHLKFDRMMLDMSIPLVRSKEQREHMEMKKQLLNEWIAELESELENKDG